MGNVVTDTGQRIPITDAGVELVTNGTFDSDVSDWDASANPSTAYFDSGELRLEADEATGIRGVHQTIDTIVGVTYQVTGTIRNGTASATYLAADDNTSTQWDYLILASTSGDSEEVSGTFTATGTQTYINLLQNPSGVDTTSYFDNISIKPLHYNTDASGPFGYLSESAGTNLLTYSEAFDNAAWTKANATITADDAVAPDGASTADLLSDDSSAGAGIVYLYDSVTVASGDNCYSLYCKADQLDWVRLYSGNFDSNTNCFFDLTNGAVGAASGTVDQGIEAVGNGWYRCWIVFNTTTDMAGEVRIYLSDGDGDVTVDLDGTSSIHIWGAQVEAGSFPTSYIKTEAATVTRSADVLTYDDVGNIEDAAGTAKCEASTLWGIAAATGYAVARDAGGRIMYVNTPYATNRISTYDGTTVSNIATGVGMNGPPRPIASAWGDNLTAYINDTADATPAAYDGTMGAGDIGVGCLNDGSGQWNGTVRLLEIHSKEGKV